MSRLLFMWDKLRFSLRLVPTLIVIGAVLLAIVLIEIDSPDVNAQLAERWPRLFGAGADGARGLLTAIASSMITVAGVTFSITVVALALASSQYTSRILRNFRRDRANQIVLGVFLGVFAYCLVVLRTIRGGDEGAFVPALAVLVAVLLAFVAIGFLVFFIHHIAASIEASSIVEGAAQETLLAIDRLFPQEMGTPSPSDAQQRAALGSLPWHEVAALSTGYIQSVDGNALLRLARERNGVVRMEKGIGDFVIERTVLAWLGGDRPDDAAVAAINGAFVLGRHRTVHQDAAYGIRQIVDVALKALSPGINDTTTAVICVDYLGAILTRLVSRRIEPRFRESDSDLCIIARGPTFHSLLAEAFDQIRQHSAGNVAVLVRMLDILDILCLHSADAERREALGQQGHWILEAARHSVRADHDRAPIVAAADRLFGRLAAP